MPGRVEGLCLIVTLCVDCKEAFGNRFKNILVRSKYNILTKYRIVSISNPWVFACISNKTHRGNYFAKIDICGGNCTVDRVSAI